METVANTGNIVFLGVVVLEVTMRDGNTKKIGYYLLYFWKSVLEVTMRDGNVNKMDWQEVLKEF